MLEALQKEWETLKNQKQTIQKQEESLLQKISEQGYTVIEGQVVEDTEVYVLFFNFGYYKNRDIFEKVSGAVEVPSSLYKELRNAFESEPVQHESVSALLFLLTEVDKRFYHSGMEHARFEYFDEDEEDECLLDWILSIGYISSDFNVSKEKRSKIAQNPVTYEEEKL